MLVCERCGGRHLRRARLQGVRDFCYAVVGVYPFRCRDCQHRRWLSVFLFSKFAYAKCPKCLGMQLSTWSRRHYNPGLLANLLITFGARQYRCPHCRCNFVSFRPWRETVVEDEQRDNDPRVGAQDSG